jgi:hypothetical protein
MNKCVNFWTQNYRMQKENRYSIWYSIFGAAGVFVPKNATARCGGL